MDWNEDQATWKGISIERSDISERPTSGFRSESDYCKTLHIVSLLNAYETLNIVEHIAIVK